MALALSLALSSGAWAQQPPQAMDTTATVLGEVEVKAKNGPLVTSRVLSSVNIIPAERLQGQGTPNNWQLFEKAPGVMLTTFGQGTTSGKLSFRAFNGEGEINAVKLLIDGIPSNSNDGNMPYIDLAPRLDIEAIEVVRGTNDPRYGLHNMAGNVNIVTRIGANYQLGRISLGSHGSREMQAAMGIEGKGFSQNYAFSYSKTNGERDHSAADSFGFSGKWFLNSQDGKSRIGLIARTWSAKAQEAGYLTAAQVAASPRQSPLYNASDEDKRRTTQLAVQGESQLGNSTFLAAQLYSNDLSDRRFVKFSAGVSQQERFVDEHHLGASVNLTWRAGKTAIGDLTLVGGLDTERQKNASERYNTLSQVRTATTRNQQFDFNTGGSFLQAVIKPTPQWTIIPALRFDHISGSYTNALNGKTYSANDYGLIRQPKLSAIYAFTNATSWYGNVGRSFQVGVGTASYKVNQTSDLAPSINNGWETGLKFRPRPWLDGRVAIWTQTASNEARRKLNDPGNDAENIGKTERQGVDLELNARPGKNVKLWFATSFQKSRIVKADASSLATQGKEIDHVPRHLFNLGVDYQHSDALRLAVWANGQGDYYLERTNSTGKFGGFTLLNASVNYQFTPALSLELQVRNLANRYYEYVWHDGTQSLHAPGPSRSAYIGLNARF